MNVSTFSPWRAACALLLLFGISGATHAASSASELGQAMPHVVNRSASALWRVYVFRRDGVRFVQINDAQGGVRAAFATANGVFMVLPMGSDADRVVVPSPPPVFSMEETCGGGCGVNRRPVNDVEEMCGDGCNVNRAPANDAAVQTLSADRMKPCGGGCTGNRTHEHGQADDAYPIAPTATRNAGTVIYADATLQIRVTENANNQQVWVVSPASRPSAPSHDEQALCGDDCHGH